MPLVTAAKMKFDSMASLRRPTYAAFFQAPHQDFGRTAIERSQIIPRTPFLSNEIVALAHSAPEGGSGFKLAEAVIAAGRSELLSIPTDRGYLGSGGALVRNARQLHRQILFKAEYWASRGMPKWLVTRKRLRAVLRVEERLLGWHKFDHFPVWIRSTLRPYIYDTLLGDSRSDLRPLVNRRELTQLLDDHFQERANRAVEIDRLLTLAIAKKSLLSAPAAIETSCA